jgi:uncharacterized protein (TIGR00297 family)
MVFNPFELAVLFGILLAFSLVCYLEKSLSRRGIFFAVIIGILVYRLGGIHSFLALVAFFAIAELVTKFSRKKQGKSHEQRTTSHIFGNSGAALIAIILGQQIAFFGAISAALADTVSSEIGLLSKKKPKLITSMKEVKPGTDGGITALGLTTGIFSAFIISLLYYHITQKWEVILIITFSGLAGTVTDSILGAVFERKKTLNNTEVNFIATLIASGIAFVLGQIIIG